MRNVEIGDAAAAARFFAMASGALLVGVVLAFAVACSGGSSGPNGGSGDPGADARSPGGPDAGGGNGGPGEGSDIVVTGAGLDPAEVEAGAQTTVFAALENRGDAEGEETLELEVDGAVEEEEKVVVPAPGEGEDAAGAEVVAEFALTRSEPGEYEVAVSGEPAGALTVFSPDPDVVVVSADAQPREVEVGEEVTVTAIVQNQGEADGQKTVELEVGGEVEDTETVEVAAPGDGEDPEDTEVGAELSFVPAEPGIHALAASGESAGEVEVTEPAELADYDIVSVDVDLAAGAFEEFSVACAEDEHEALAGGVNVSAPGGEETDTRVHYSGPGSEGSRAAWVAGVSSVGTETESLEVMAVCARPPPAFEAVTETLALSAGDAGDLEVECPADTVALGGGARVFGAGEPETRLEYQGPRETGTEEADGWQVGVASEGDAVDVEVSAHCASAPDGYLVLAEDFHDVGGRDFDEIRNPRCPLSDQLLLSGGVATEGDTRVHYGYPSELNLSGGWFTGISNESFSSTDITAYAVCADA